ncbi:uncharacterized protein DUF1127 [Breoghania corrubedonensis]|uniref:Uncharacterized protein DUF1127 n=1 Tax=Breoghania corrubedonensis TaxID=665038 RepID=A0A2T5VB34_9HYPH|nr:DUF1127 domain-containing protein [Breoghania corrubedonensis]PTW60962.1 uncharacterized protein DUF1127 [Breoghania corrubedonensis]
MTATDTTAQRTSRRFAPFSMIVMRKLRAAVLRAWRRRQRRRALDRLDDRMLSDIGLSRGAHGYDPLPSPGRPTRGDGWRMR